MNMLNVKATKTNPAVVYTRNGKLTIKGRSIPSDVKAFYQPLFEWADKLLTSKLTVEIDLEYMNSASSKKLLSLLKMFNNNKQIEKLNVIWHYEEGDEEILASGQIFEKLLPRAVFRFKENKESA